MTEEGQVSVPAVQQYLRQAEASGIDASGLLVSLGLAPALSAEPGARLSATVFETLMQSLLQQSADPLFGLRTSQHIVPASYSVLGYIAMNCATLGEALARVPVYEKIVGDLGVTDTRPVPGGLEITWTCHFADPSVRRHVTENVLGSWVRYSRWMTASPSESPCAVWFAHDAPPAGEVAEYEQLFRCPVRFGAPTSGLMIRDEQLDRPIREADPVLLATLLEHASAILASLATRTSLSERVRNLLRLLLRQSLPRKETIAAQVGLNPRTLQRRLDDEGTGYQKLLDEVRLEMARQYLGGSSMSVEDIGALIGFSETRSFHRVFKQWTGMTPGQYREVTVKAAR
jgi:AraC-like DNA-binding protein